MRSMVRRTSSRVYTSSTRGSGVAGSEQAADSHACTWLEATPRYANASIRRSALLVTSLREGGGIAT